MYDVLTIAETVSKVRSKPHLKRVWGMWLCADSRRASFGRDMYEAYYIWSAAK